MLLREFQALHDEINGKYFYQPVKSVSYLPVGTFLDETPMAKKFFLESENIRAAREIQKLPRNP